MTTIQVIIIEVDMEGVIIHTVRTEEATVATMTTVMVAVAIGARPTDMVAMVLLVRNLNVCLLIK